jgi:hypothetical protein
MPTGSASNIEGPIHVDRYLTNYSESFLQDARMFIAGRAASLVGVQNQSDMYLTYDRGYFWRDESAPRPLGGRPQQVGYKVSQSSYNAIEWALEHIVDDRQRANVDNQISLDRNATSLLTQKQLIRADRIWAQNFFVPNVWSSLVVGTASTPGTNQFLEFNDADSDPIGVIDEYKDTFHQRTGFMPNTLVIGAKVKRHLRSHPDIADRIKYTQIGIAEEDLLARLFDIPTVVTARSVYNSAAEGATNSFTYIANSRAMLMAYIEPTPSLDSPTAIINFAWQGLIPGQMNNFGGVMTRGRDNRAYSDWFHNRMAFDLRQGAADLGIFFQNVVAA